MTEQLTFEATSHTYTYAGTPVPSVSFVLNNAGLGGDFTHVAPEVLLAAQRRGIAVHLGCEDIDRGRHLWNNDDVLPEEYRPYLAAYRRFLAESKFESASTEERVYHPTLGYAGTLDVRGVLNGRHVIGDRKATASLHPDTAIQVELYRLAWNAVHPEHEAAATFGLHLRGDGSYRLALYHDPIISNVARAAVKLATDPDHAIARRIVLDWTSRYPR